ncbi:MAG TPA: hypothetical protein GXX40_05775 [Firmicutes bacterium]|nr:hypothetical protein [Bacillota bacterium]
MEFWGTVPWKKTDKLASVGLTAVPAQIVQAVVVKEFAVNPECEVFNAVPAGSHDVFVARIMAIHVNAQFVDGRSICSRWEPWFTVMVFTSQRPGCPHSKRRADAHRPASARLCPDRSLLVF